jgi:hypothetical protein
MSHTAIHPSGAVAVQDHLERHLKRVTLKRIGDLAKYVLMVRLPQMPGR